MKIKLTYEQLELIKSNSNVIYDGENKWYHIPFYYKESSHGVTEQFFFHELPKHVKNYHKQIEKLQ